MVESACNRARSRLCTRGLVDVWVRVRPRVTGTPGSEDGLHTL